MRRNPTESAPVGALFRPLTKIHCDEIDNRVALDGVAVNRPEIFYIFMAT